MFEPLKKHALHPEQLKTKLDVFMRDVQKLITLLNINLLDYQLDHIALRINDPQLASLSHQAWEEKGKVISQAIINQRSIVVVELDTPLMLSNWKTWHLELPYPQVNKKYAQQGWEHVEFVIESKATTAEAYLADIQTRFPDFASQLPFLESQGVMIKLSSPKATHERLANPTIAFKWNDICIKLHPYSLKTVIQSEQK